jgi:hypothetical protein
MHGVSSVKLINAQQARQTKNYKDTKENLVRTYATIRFNKICKID